MSDEHMSFDEAQDNAPAELRQPWHRPTLTALQVNVHTRNFSYNGSDGTGNFTGS